MGSGNVAPAPVSETPLNPLEFEVLPPPHAAASSTTAATAAVAAIHRLNLRMLPPSVRDNRWCGPRSRILGRGFEARGGYREASNPLPGKPPLGRLLGLVPRWTSHGLDASGS